MECWNLLACHWGRRKERCPRSHQPAAPSEPGSSRPRSVVEEVARDDRTRGGESSLWYPLPRRGVRVVDGAALEKRCAKAPRVRIPPSPPALIGHTADRYTAGRFR